MPQKDYISLLLDMEGLKARDLQVKDTEIEIEFELPRRVHRCPECGGLTDQVHDYRTQIVKDTPAMGKRLIWRYHKRRYGCPYCGKRFYESNYLLPKYHRITNRLAAFCIGQLKRKCSQKEIATNAGVSASTIGRWLKLLTFTRPKSLPTVLAIDEFRGNTDRGKFQCILTAPVKRAIVDILPSRDSCEILEYLRSFPNRENLKYFIMDMSRPYLDIAQSLFPKATIVIDRFHVVRYCTWALENVRKREQRKLRPEERKYFKRSRKLLLAHMSKLTVENKQAVERMLLVSRDLREAYLLKEAFYEFMAAESSAVAKTLLTKFRMYAAIAQIPEFDACLTMLNNWERYILNAFDCPYTNAFTEGSNNSIKVIKRVAYGYRNFENFRSRILHSLNTIMEPATP